MLSNLSAELSQFITNSQTCLVPWTVFFILLWGFNIFYWLFGSFLGFLGLYPRSLIGLFGVSFSPLLHQNFNHLFFNTIPLYTLGLVLMARDLKLFINVTVFVIIASGCAVWLVGRKALHIGASGVVSGYFGYLLATVYTNPSFTGLIIAVLVVYYFGGIFIGIFPQEEKVSWETHLCGFLSGVLCAFFSDGVWSHLDFYSQFFVPLVNSYKAFTHHENVILPMS